MLNPAAELSSWFSLAALPPGKCAGIYSQFASQFSLRPPNAQPMMTKARSDVVRNRAWVMP